ncbi:S8 family peptidase [Noviherbaspirillum galbum]|uniref:S8 family serine peptidase n=1 Tax=Noviherbaspirillum galbum TaxID=2709383 RepID=A0A6B3SMA8_9BURK|nr:S8 family serine peptidase [Noviherbaspirillum galbum]NEX59502.1 S8 family serine peptidase [Noviherbaspirillum galbum]
MGLSALNRKIIYGADGTTIGEVDIYDASGRNLVEADHYEQGRLQGTTKYLADGRTVSEIGRYTYADGLLTTITRWFPASKTIMTTLLDAGGQTRETDVAQYDASARLSEVRKSTGGGLLFEVDRYSEGKLAAVTSYLSSGDVSSVAKYASDGVTISEVDSFQYIAVSGHLASVSKADATGKVFEIDYYDDAGHMAGVARSATIPAPAGSPPPVPSRPQVGPPALPPTASLPAPAWSKDWGFGQADLLKALGAVLGRTIADQAAPASIQGQWALDAMHVDDAWQAGYAGRGVIIADIDTGIDMHNASLTRNLSRDSWNFIDHSANVQDDNGHGTFTASEMIAANDGRGVVGAAYDAKLMVLKAMDARGHGATADLVAAIDHAVAHGANVINLSIGSATAQSEMEAALRNASSHGVIVCISVGNTGGDSPEYPAHYAQSIPNCIAVGADQPSVAGTGAVQSSFSAKAGTALAYPYVVAPGMPVKGYGLDGTAQNWWGTSMASPLVAAEAAILLSAQPSLPVDQLVQDIVHGTVALVGVAPATSHG